MSNGNTLPPRVSSSASTGGAGTFFEQHVGAYWLSLLLTRAIPPILVDCSVSDVHFQTERLGWNTDDFLIVGENGKGLRRTLAGQVKRTFTVSASDEECTKAIGDFWLDFKDGGRFSPASDGFALVTLRGTNTLLESFSGLLECARAARNAAEFEARLGTPGHLNAKAIAYCDEIKKIIDDVEKASVPMADCWPFLKSLHVLSLDLTTGSRQTEALAKSLLAHTATDRDSIGAAEATWNTLLAEVGEGMPAARSYGRMDLPPDVLARHSCVEAPDQRALDALKDHSSFVLKQIRSKIGPDLHLPRAGLVQSIVDQVEAHQVVLVSGAAGSGKSGAAKSAVESLARDHFAFCFRAEELSKPSLDEALHLAQIRVGSKALGAILAGQERKVLLVESVERLLEASTRDAFADLLTLLEEDRSWRLLLTCRDYSIDLVRSSLLETRDVSHTVVAVPDLDDAELAEVEAAYPGLARPLASDPLRRLLRNPYVVDKARLISWTADNPLPTSEREFRSLFWRDLIRVESRAADGMPLRRERAFVEVALRRARALTLFARCHDLDPAALEKLRSDSIIVRSEASGQHFAPTHDVLEDWGILHWIDESFTALDGPLGGLSEVIGTYPAIRRSYRKWVGELLERDPVAADRLFLAALDRNSSSNQFCDDTLVAFLRSKDAAIFLDRHREALFSGGKALLKRVIHLLRIACVATPTWSRLVNGASPLFTMPDGPAWAAVLGLVANRLDYFERDDDILLVGLIEDWASGVSWFTPYPEGADSAARIGHSILGHFDDYRSDDQRKRVLKVLSKIPKIEEERFAAILLNQQTTEPDQASKDLRKIILEGIEGMPACRDVPELVVEAANEHFLLSESDLQDGDWYTSSMNSEAIFGIPWQRNHDFFPPSAYRGPFLPLLRHHSKRGLEFLLAMFNHSIRWYVDRKVYAEYIEPTFEMVVTLPSGTTRTQWYNQTLWYLYRGTSVGPHILQCGLMALEFWLFEVAEASPTVLDSLLLKILSESDSGALTAVVASLATAHPHNASEALLCLLNSKECILLDRGRLVSELQAASLARMSSMGAPVNRIYGEERQQANARPHRRHDLEAAALNLQMGKYAARVHALLDLHIERLPALDEQDESDRIWRLALHRMDLRRYSFRDKPDHAVSQAEGEPGAEAGKQYFVLQAGEPAPDLQEMASRSEADSLQTANWLNLQLWGLKVFEGSDESIYDPADWRGRLDQAMSHQYENGSEFAYSAATNGPGLVAAVCVRDHWDELLSNEREWCVGRICLEVERTGDRWDEMARVQRFSMSADRPCARTLPTLLMRNLSAEMRSRVVNTLVVAATHPVDEIRWYAARGIGENLWSVDREMTLRFVNALASEAKSAQDAFDEESKKAYRDRTGLDLIERKIAEKTRRQFFEPGAILGDALAKLDPARWIGAEAYICILAILGEAPEEHASIEAFERAARILAGWWDSDDRRDDHRERSIETEVALRNLLQDFLFRAPVEKVTTIIEPILDAVNRHPREVSWVLLGIIGVEDRSRLSERFWALWQLFADRVRVANWLKRIDQPHPWGGELLTVVLLGSSWKEDVKHWRSLEGHADRVHSFYESLPASAIVMEDYLKFLYHIGEQSLPHAFIRIARRLKEHEPTRQLINKEAVFMLEALLRRHVYVRPHELKSNRELREAVLLLLDALVELGSSSAFRMRDDFVTPIAASSR